MDESEVSWGLGLPGWEIEDEELDEGVSDDDEDVVEEADEDVLMSLYLKAWVQKRVRGPCESQKWQSPIIAFMRCSDRVFFCFYFFYLVRIFFLILAISHIIFSSFLVLFLEI